MLHSELLEDSTGGLHCQYHPWASACIYQEGSCSPNKCNLAPASLNTGLCSQPLMWAATSVMEHQGQTPCFSPQLINELGDLLGRNLAATAILLWVLKSQEAPAMFTGKGLLPGSLARGTETVGCLWVTPEPFPWPGATDCCQHSLLPVLSQRPSCAAGFWPRTFRPLHNFDFCCPVASAYQGLTPDYVGVSLSQPSLTCLCEAVSG